MHRNFPVQSKMPYSIINDSKVIIDYSAIFCGSPVKLLKSALFMDVLARFYAKISRKKTPTYIFLREKLPKVADKDVPDFLVNMFLLLVGYSADELVGKKDKHAVLLGADGREWIAALGRDLYNYWRRFERFVYMEMPKKSGKGRAEMHHAHFVRACENLRDLVMETNRILIESLAGIEPNVYRQLPAGSNMGMAIENIEWNSPAFLADFKGVPFVRLALMEPPLILYSRSNTRKGIFKEISKADPRVFKVAHEEWFCFPVKAGELTVFVYFHRDYISLALSLCNLFEIADYGDIYKKTPDAVVLFGVPGAGMTELTEYFEDKKSGVMVGLVKHSDEADYFGYFKKMILTLHNAVMINRGRLPIHGAMVHLKLKNGGSANVAIMGDSGAGKSETLEALRSIAEEHFSEMKVIFDDMGSLAVDAKGRVVAYGTEIGAFVRLDDLSPRYAYDEMDRSIFINPDKKNARLVVPVSQYKEISAGYPLDIFLYANNYEPIEVASPLVEFFEDVGTAMDTFRRGARFAKGTTDEKGLVHTYFANPFGAWQRRKRHDAIALKTVTAMFKSGVKVGEIRTRLGIEGFEQEGPMAVALELNKVIMRISKKKRK
ncbi:MAG: phosphoenolpyruvate carboxykinase [Nitrospinae bacterium]|nr:phosphoenolpyruvate carboxykinase [Nitrospinota bacterium]